MQDSHGGLGSHHRDLRRWPCVHGCCAQAAGVHRDVGAAVCLAGDDGDAGHSALGERIEQFRAAPDHTFPFLADAWEVTRHIDQDDQRYSEGVAHPYETGRLFGGRHVEAAATAQRVVRDHADRAATEPAERGDDVRCPLRVEFEHLAVKDARDQRAHIVRAAG